MAPTGASSEHYSKVREPIPDSPTPVRGPLLQGTDNADGTDSIFALVVRLFGRGGNKYTLTAADAKILVLR